MEPQPIRIDMAGCAMTVTMQRPPVNALGAQFVDGLNEVITAAEDSPEITVMVVRSAEKVFSAGGDIKLMARLLDADDGAEQVATYSAKLQRLLIRLAEAPLVTIAVLEGAALGGGLELAMACDIRLAVRGTTLGLPEANIGLLPGAGGTQRLAELAGHSFAMRIITTSETFTAEEGLDRGVVSEVHTPVGIGERTSQLVSLLADRDRATIAQIKRCIRTSPRTSGFEAETDATRILAGRASTRERMHAFLGSRPTRSNS